MALKDIHADVTDSRTDGYSGIDFSIKDTVKEMHDVSLEETGKDTQKDIIKDNLTDDPQDISEVDGVQFDTMDLASDLAYGETCLYTWQCSD